jgi:hypothetical protein
MDVDLEAVAPDASPLVGFSLREREAELAAIADATRAVGRGESRLLVVEAPAGMGRPRS